MARDNAEMTKRFRVAHNFDKFHTGEEVEAILYPDCFAIEGNGGELKVPYKEIQYIAHCETPEARMLSMTTSGPYLFGADSIGAFAAEAAASFGMAGAEYAAAPNIFKWLFFVGYFDGREERWVMLRDERNYDSISFVHGLSSRANKRIIRYYSGMIRKTGEYFDY